MDLKGSPISIDEFERFQLGDEQAFQKIFECYKSILYGRVRRLACSAAEAEEIVQEVFIQLFLKRSDIPAAEAIFPFLYIASKRMAISNFRKEVIRKEYRLESKGDLYDTSSCSQTKLEQKEYEQLLDKVIDTLPAQQKLVYRMNKLENRSYKEIAEHIGISRHTVRNHLAAACNSIKLRFQKILFSFFALSLLQYGHPNTTAFKVAVQIFSADSKKI
ncbi:RNA polymerase sigma factor [Sphingobacterium thalpophilum]|uniref:RNA polymerase sigma factor n=1 Tax=Sphingobacterium thalpophilum TaxID=259 RepID=UPI002D790CBC|nr:sigma-70 family RNA polymerase sigma factor [Sphingobacterium thalpophilum]